MGKAGSRLPSSRKVLRATPRGSDWREKWARQRGPEGGEAGLGAGEEEPPLPENVQVGHGPTAMSRGPWGLKKGYTIKPAGKVEGRQCRGVGRKRVKTLTGKIFMNLDTALRKPLKEEKQQPTSLRMNEITAACLQTTLSSSTQLL